jgi:hypothetical protein
MLFTNAKTSAVFQRVNFGPSFIGVGAPSLDKISQAFVFPQHNIRCAT